MEVLFIITPVGKPRMTRADTWKKRPCVAKYWDFKDNLLKDDVLVNQARKLLLSPYKLIFWLPMPRSWSKKKKRSHDGQPHKQKPDKDNLEKAFLDALLGDDSAVWSGWVEKRWSYEGAIALRGLYFI